MQESSENLSDFSVYHPVIDAKPMLLDPSEISTQMVV